MMNILEIIAKKRDGLNLSKEEISFFVKEYTKGIITDYQAAAFVMAIYINGMNEEEITNLSLEMAHSGEILDLSKLGENIVDKHSTGGVGDKVTLILAPIVASLGIPVAKMSGRGLGFTGGTIDKLESIPGYNTNVKIGNFIQNVQKIGISLIGQTLNLAPADKKLYALRDSIACTQSIPLIASSIMSKKIASGANKIVLDVTVGSGAFMKNIQEAKKLSEIMIKIGNLANKQTVCVITNMDEPLGYAVGNTLEVIEAINCLKGNIPEDVKQVVLELGSYMIKLAGKGDNIEENKKLIIQNIENKKAYQKFIQLVENQGGDATYITDISKFEKAKFVMPVKAKKAGYVKSLNAEKVGQLSANLGAGRLKKEDNIDKAVGIILNKKIGDSVEVGDILAHIHSNDNEKGRKAQEELQSIYEITNKNVQPLKYIIDIVK